MSLKIEIHDQNGKPVSLSVIRSFAAIDPDAAKVWSYLERGEKHSKQTLYHATYEAEAAVAQGIITDPDDAALIPLISRYARRLIDEEWHDLSVVDLERRNETLKALASLGKNISDRYDFTGVKYDVPEGTGGFNPIDALDALDALFEFPSIVEAARRMVPKLAEFVKQKPN